MSRLSRLFLHCPSRFPQLCCSARDKREEPFSRALAFQGSKASWSEMKTHSLCRHSDNSSDFLSTAAPVAFPALAHQPFDPVSSIFVSSLICVTILSVH
ncbi:hypothetical protein ACLOJK_010178 [Asimina triloba]